MSGSIIVSSPRGSCYQVKDRIGRGEFGAVSRAEVLGTRSPVAVKVVRLARFEPEEVRILHKLAAHQVPHSACIRSDFEIPATALASPKQCIVMDWVSSPNLHQLVNHSRIKLPLDDIKSIAFQTLEYLAALEAQRIVHRDLKPENMIWNGLSRHLTVVDMGSALQLDSRDRAKSGMTELYASPEYILGKPATTATDLWSLGCILFELIVGVPLFVESSDDSEPENLSLFLQIVEQLGEPSEAYLEDATKRGMFYDESGEIVRSPNSLEKSYFWLSHFIESLEDYHISNVEKKQWIDLLSMLLSYENRGSAKEHLSNPLLSQDVNFHLLYDTAFKCKMFVIRAGLFEDPHQEVTLDNMPPPDIALDFTSDKCTCLHSPQDPSGEYVIILEKDGYLVRRTIALTKSDHLDITDLQRMLPSATRKSLFAEDGEPRVKKTKSDASD